MGGSVASFGRGLSGWTIFLLTSADAARAEHAARVPGRVTPIHYWTWQVYPERIPVMRWWPIDYAWVYLDAVRPEGGPAPRAP